MKRVLVFQVTALGLVSLILASAAVAREKTKKPLSSTAQMVGEPWIGAGGAQEKLPTYIGPRGQKAGMRKLARKEEATRHT